MKHPRLHPVLEAVVITAACIALLINATAATTESAGNKTPAATNSTPEQPAIPLSVFELTNGAVKDPFFPNSMRHPVEIKTAAPTFSRDVIILKGLSGSAGERLALINNRTLAVGEDAEITTTAGKVKIRLVEIRESSVLIRASTLPDVVEISLRKSAQ